MTPAERIRKCRLLEEMRTHKDAANKLGLKNLSRMQVDNENDTKTEYCRNIVGNLQNRLISREQDVYSCF